MTPASLRGKVPSGLARLAQLRGSLFEAQRLLAFPVGRHSVAIGQNRQGDGLQSARLSIALLRSHAAEHNLRGTAGEFDRGAGAEREIPTDGQLGNAVHERPGCPRERQPIASRQIARLLCGGDTVEQNTKRIVPDILILAVLAQGWRQIEHHEEMLRPAQGKVYVTTSAQLESLPWCRATRQGLLHHGGEPVESLLGDRHEQFILPRKMAVRCVVRDPRTASNLSQREGARADLTDQNHGGIEQGLAKVGVMVRLRIGHT